MTNEEIWSAVERHLLAGSALLVDGGAQPKSDDDDGMLLGTKEEFDRFMAHNELELAWDTLATIAERHVQSSVFWAEMASAAALMGLHEKAATAHTHKAGFIFRE